MPEDPGWALCPVCQHPVAEHTAMRGWVTGIAVIVVCVRCRLMGLPSTCQSSSLEP